MFVTLTNVQMGGVQLLQQTIDNREGKLTIGLRSFICWVGWHNVPPGEFVTWKNSTHGKLAIAPGLYCFDQLAELVSGTVSGLVISVDKATGVITFVVPVHCKFQFSSGLASLLGLPTDWLRTGTHTGAALINMWPRALHVYFGPVVQHTQCCGRGSFVTSQSCALPRYAVRRQLRCGVPQSTFQTATVRDDRRVEYTSYRWTARHKQPRPPNIPSP